MAGYLEKKAALILRPSIKSIISHVGFRSAVLGLLLVGASFSAEKLQGDNRLPPIGYIAYHGEDGNIYVKFFADLIARKIVDKGGFSSLQCARINYINPNMIAYIARSYAGNDNGPGRIFVVNIDGTNSREITRSEIGCLSDISWTDRNTIIMGAADRCYNVGWGPRPEQIYIMDTLGNKTLVFSTDTSDQYGRDGVGRVQAYKTTLRWGYGDGMIYTFDQDNPTGGLSNRRIFPKCHGTLSYSTLYTSHSSGDHCSLTLTRVSDMTDIGGVPTIPQGCGVWDNTYSNNDEYFMLWENSQGAMIHHVLNDSFKTDMPVTVIRPGYATEDRGPSFYVGNWSQRAQTSPVSILWAENDPATGSRVIDSMTVTLRCFDVNAAIRYTTDGSDPTSGSTLYSQPFGCKISGNSVTIKTTATQTPMTASHISSKVIQKVALHSATAVSNAAPKLLCRIFDGNAHPSPNSVDPLHKLFGQIAPTSTALEDTMKWIQDGANTSHSWDGYIMVGKSGTYTFTFYGDGKLWIDDSLLVSTPQGATDVPGSIALAAGFHSFKAAASPWNWGRCPVVKYEGRDVAKQKLPASVLFNGGPVGVSNGLIASVNGPTAFSIRGPLVRYSPGTNNERAILRINSVDGRSIDVPRAAQTRNGFAWDLGKLHRGIYTLTLTTGDRCISRRIVVGR